MKHYEPNNSWLQNVQIEKVLLNRRDLLSIEKVERASELASAEWIAAEKKAVVTKRSGLNWSSFGLEKNSVLYLLPEEALFLLETVCIFKIFIYFTYILCIFYIYVLKASHIKTKISI